MSIEPAVDILKELLRPSGRSKIKTLDMTDIWKIVFQSTKLPEQIKEVSELISEVYSINPSIREKQCNVIDIIIDNFGSSSIEVDQRFEAALPIFKLLCFFDDRNIEKAASSMVEIFSAYTENLEDVPFDILSDFQPFEKLPKTPLESILKTLRLNIGHKNESSMALVLTILYNDLIENVPETKQVTQELILSLFKGNSVKIAIGCNLLFKSIDNFDKSMPITQEIILILYKQMSSEEKVIADAAYEIVKATIKKGFFKDERNMEKILNTRLRIRQTDIHRVYKLLSLFIECDKEGKYDIPLISVLSAALHQIIIDRQTYEYEEGFAFMCQASIIDACEGVIQSMYKEELKAARSFVERNLVHSYAGISAFLCSISGFVGFKGSEKVAELVPRIVEAAKTKELTIEDKDIIGRSLSIMISSGKWHNLREIVTELAEYQMNDAKKEISIIGAEMVREMGKMVAISRIADLSASMIDIIETDADVDVVMNTFKAMKSLIINYDFESSSFSNILSLIADNKLPCTTDIFSVEDPWPAFKFVEVFADRYPDTCGKIAQQLAEWTLVAPDKMLKCVFRPFTACVRNDIVNRSQLEEVIPKMIELLDSLAVSFEKVHSCIIESLWYIFHQSHEGFDVSQLYTAIEGVITLYDHPKKGGELSATCFAAMIIMEIAVKCKEEVEVSEPLLITMINELPFKPELYLMDTAMNFVCELISDQFRFGEERLSIFKLISKILMMDDKTIRNYGFTDATLAELHEKLQLECKTNGYVMCNLNSYYEKTETETITFESLLN